MTRLSARRRLLVVGGLVLLATLLAGCASDTTSEDPSPISAREAIEEARPTVETWNEDAELLVLSGFEGGEDSPALERQRTDEQQEGFPLHEDTLVGDGRAPQWVMVFLGDEQTRSVRVTAEETVWMDEGGRQAGPGARPVGNWTIDSTDAIQRAMEDSEDLDRIVAASDASVFFTLGGGSQGPRWQLRASSHSQAAQEVLFVDARSGEVENRTQAQTTVRTEEFADQLTREEPNATHPVTVEQNGTRLPVELTWNASAGEEGVRLSADLRSDGTSVGEPARAGQDSDRFHARWNDVPAGEYEIEIVAEEWGEREQVDYELSVHMG